ncbi:hypothetical protein [Sphingopyxis sp.]|uniref:hypothetical protein n=1 Tax=Sphingopyxis sp. TaxID=1908224 RepID=UPI003D6D2EE9
MLRSLPPVPAWSSALIAALVGFGGTIALVVQAMRNLGASADQTGSAVTATGSGLTLFGLGSAFCGLVVGFLALAASRWLTTRA